MENQVPPVKALLHYVSFGLKPTKHSNASAHPSRADIEVAVFSFPRRVADVQIATEHDCDLVATCGK